MARSTRLAIVVAVTLASVPAFEAMADRPCPPDTNCSGAVEANDLLAVIAAWGSADPIADIDDSGIVDVNDLLAVITTWGPCLFEFGSYANAEAHRLGLEMLGVNGPVALPLAAYTRIDRDMGLIRAAYPALISAGHAWAWAPNQIILGIFQGQPTVELQCYNTFYQVTNDHFIFAYQGVEFHTYTFAGHANMLALASIYTDLPEVSHASPNYIAYTGQVSSWTRTIMPNDTWRWDIENHYLNCNDVCWCHRHYVIDVDVAGVVTLISYTQSGPPKLCGF